MAASVQDLWSPGAEGMHYRLNVEQLHQMLAAGVIHDGKPIELLEVYSSPDIDSREYREQAILPADAVWRVQLGEASFEIAVADLLP